MKTNISHWFYQTLISLVSFALIVSCGSDSSSPNTTHPHANSSVGSVHGEWIGSRTIETIVYDFQIQIESNRIKESTRCRFSDGTSLTAAITVAAQIDDKVIRVTESQIDQSQSGTKYCGVTLSPRDIAYELRDDKLIVTNLNQGLTDELTKSNR